MTDYFSQYSGTAAAAADQYGIPQPIFFGLIQQESSWNPSASASTSSAFGFTQLLSGTAQDLGVNRFDPVQNLYGGAQYLASMPGSNWTDKLAHYYQGPGATIASSGLSYAKGVLDKASKFLTSGTAVDAARLAAGDPTALLSLGGDLFGGGGDSCGINPICYLRQWITSTSFFARLALATLALLFILGGLYLMKDD